MRFLTSGESHGPKVSAIVEGFLKLPLNKEECKKSYLKDRWLWTRRRMQIAGYL